jgi:5-methyltetrahydrofolate--homocysteine methyltransferase
MDRIIRPDERTQLVAQNADQARKTMSRPDRGSFIARPDANDTVRSETSVLDQIPTPPFWGVQEPTDFTVRDIWPHLDLKTLFRLHWGGKGVKDEAWTELLENEFNPRLNRMQEEVERTRWMQPRARYGYFPANSEGNDLIVFDPVDQDRELTRFAFPRQPARERLCLADYFLPLSTGRKDVVAFQIVTMGAVADAYTDELQAKAEYSESYFAHGLSVQSAEGLAEYMHQRVRRELGIGEEGGKRYSWGYPACPDLDQHALVDKLLDVGSIGVEVTNGFQFNPEQTTAAIVIHHPDAKYYALARTGAAE